MKTIERVTPTNDQKTGLAHMKKFMKDPIAKEFILNGRAGTGKTTILRELFAKKQRGKSSYYIPQFVTGMTVAHKARINLEKSIPKTITYASGCNLQMKFDDYGKIYFIPKSKRTRVADELRRIKYLVFDEASMVDTEMRIIINETLPPGCKVIYTGDHHQLPPINAKGDQDSEVFSLPWKYELTEFVRQKEGDHILDMCNMTCNSIDNGQSFDFMKNFKTPKFNMELQKGYASTGREKGLESYIRAIKEGGLPNVRYTAFTNARVRQINKSVREELYGQNIKYFEPGDFVVMYSQYDPDNFGSPVAFNGEEMFVSEIRESTMRDIKCWELYLKRPEDEEPISKPFFVVHTDDKSKFNNKKFELLNEAKKTHEWSSFMDYINQFAELDHGYCVTNYKIQGTTLNTCYVDVDNILSVSKISNKRKLQAMYVGFSRPTHRLAAIF